MSKKNKNGLKLLKIKSQVEYYDVQKLDDILKILGNDQYNFVLYHFSYVSFGTINNKEIKYYNNLSIPEDLSNVQKIRIFNENCELLVWKTGNKLAARLRKDSEGDEVDVIEAKQITYGTTNISLKENSEFELMYEESGNQFYIPKLDFTVDPKNRLAIKTRNYIDYYPNGIATFTDTRFVKFTKFNSED